MADRLKKIVALLWILSSPAALWAAPSLEHARDLLDEAREELEAVLTSDGSSAEDRTAALALLKQLNGEQATAPAAPSTGQLVDNGDGTASDPVTGLTWALKDSGGPTTFEGAASNCGSSKRAGHDDWRLPTLADIRSLIVDKFAGNYRVSPLLQLTSCTPWVVNDRLDAPSFMEADLCDGGGMVVNAKWKRAPALCVRGPRIP